MWVAWNQEVLKQIQALLGSLLVSSRGTLLVGTETGAEALGRIPDLAPFVQPYPL